MLLSANVVGTALLLTIMGIAILSFPTPLQRFAVPSTFVAEMPFVWLPAVLVQAAWMGHLLVFRRLSQTR